MKIIAKNKKYQSKVNRAVHYLIQHNEANDLRDEASNYDDVKTWAKFDRICQTTYDKYLEVISELPQGEINAIEKKLW